MSRYRFVAAEKLAAQPVTQACAALEVSRSAYYRWSQSFREGPSQRAQADAALGERIASIHAESRGTYGSPRVQRQLAREGTSCSRKRVARLMASRGLAGRFKRRFRQTTIADPTATSLAPDRLQRAFQPDAFALNRAWVGDISYLRTWEGWCYLATVIDLASRRVVGFAVAGHLRTSLICEALEMATKARRPAPGLGLPLRPRQPVHLARVHPTARRPGHRAVAEPAAPVQGQRRGGELLRHAEDGARLP